MQPFLRVGNKREMAQTNGPSQTQRSWMRPARATQKFGARPTSNKEHMVPRHPMMMTGSAWVRQFPESIVLINALTATNAI